MGSSRAVLSSCLVLLMLAAAACADDDTSGPTSGSGGSGASTSSSSTAGGAGGMGAQGGGGAVNVAPAAPTNLVLALAANPYGVSMGWQAPGDADLAGYIAARSPTPFDAGNTPIDGQTYGVGDTLPGGAEVVFADSTLSGLDSEAPLEATSHYAVFALDSGGLYSPPASDAIDIGFPAQTGSIQISNITSGATVSILEQPSHLQLSGTATYTVATSTLTLSLGVTNMAHRILFSPKVAVDTINAGTAASDGTTVDGRVSAYYGPAGLAVGATRTRDVVITGTGSTDPVVLDVEVLNNPMGCANGTRNKGTLNYFDLSGAVNGAGRAFGGQSSYSLGWKTAAALDGALAGGVFSPDGASYYAGWKSRPIVAQIDMTTLQAVTSTDLSQGGTNYGISSRVLMSADGTSLYTLVTTGAHHFSGGPNYTGSSSVDLVRLDRASLAETGRLALVSNGPVQPNTRPTKGNDVALSADGSRLVAVVEPGQLWIVDAANFAVIDADASTPGDQPVDVSGVSPAARIAALDATGSTAYVGYHRATGSLAGEDLLSVVDLSSFAVSTMTSSSTAGMHSLGWSALTLGPDGKLYIARNQSLAAADVGLSVFDPSSNSYDDTVVGRQVMGLLFDPRGGRYYVLQRNAGASNNTGEILTYDASTHGLIDIDADGSNGQTNLPALSVSTFSAHAQNITPF